MLSKRLFECGERVTGLPAPDAVSDLLDDGRFDVLQQLSLRCESLVQLSCVRRSRKRHELDERHKVTRFSRDSDSRG